jgi:branched-chain amino acid transport system permease protein
VLERTLYRPMYARAPRPGDVSIGLTFMAVAAIDYFVGSSQQNIQLPEWLQGAPRFGVRADARHRPLPALHHRRVRCCSHLVLQLILSKTRFGSRLRAAVDDARVARGLGINVNRCSLLTFALGSGLAGLGGALGIEILGLDPTFPLKYMIYFLIVVTVGGTSSITGPLAAALLLGIADVAASTSFRRWAPSPSTC